MLAVDVLDIYLREIAAARWLAFSEPTIAIATKSYTRPDKEGGAYSIAERADAIAAELGIVDPQSIALIEIFAKWRNSVAHNSERPSQVAPRLRLELIRNKAAIAARHSHLDIELALRNYEARTVPVPKEVTSLTANAVRFVRRLDEAAIRRVASTSGDMETAAEAALTNFFAIAKNPHSIVADVLQGVDSRRVNAITKILASVGITQSTELISSPLSDQYIKTVIGITPKQFMDRFHIP